MMPRAKLWYLNMRPRWQVIGFISFAVHGRTHPSAFLVSIALEHPAVRNALAVTKDRTITRGSISISGLEMVRRSSRHWREANVQHGIQPHHTVCTSNVLGQGDRVSFHRDVVFTRCNRNIKRQVTRREPSYKPSPTNNPPTYQYHYQKPRPSETRMRLASRMPVHIAPNNRHTDAQQTRFARQVAKDRSSIPTALIICCPPSRPDHVDLYHDLPLPFLSSGSGAHYNPYSERKKSEMNLTRKLRVALGVRLCPQGVQRLTFG